MQKQTSRRADSWGWPWLVLCVALALHVLDEAMTDFLSTYNPIAYSLREQYAWLLLPTFTFRTWLTGLVTAVSVLAVMSPLAFRDVGWMRPLGYLLGVVMMGNGLLHIAVSLYWGKLAPGVFSSPFLAAAAFWLLISLWHSREMPGGFTSG